MAFCCKVPLVICTNRELGFPVLFRVDQNRIILSCMHIKNRCFHAVFHFNALHGKVYSCFCFSCHNCHCIPYETKMLIQDHSVIRTELRIGLSGRGETSLWNIFPGKDQCHSFYLHGCVRLDLFHPGIGIGTP